MENIKKIAMKLVRITTIYNEIFIRKEIKRDKKYLYTTDGNIPLDEILYIDTLGKII